MDWARKKRPNFLRLTSKCDLDLGDSDLGLACDALSYDGQHFCQVFYKIHQGWAKFWTEHKK